ncbi:MAG: DNA polymerase IV, partial [Ghiorsea sp.]|nr:DNA polymerase IV [Ghiorsea sp.]
AYFGKSAAYYYNIARGVDERGVKSFRARKSLGKETTFAQDIKDVDVLLGHFKALVAQVFQGLDKHKLQGKTITIKVKYADFKQVTRSKTEPNIINPTQALTLIPKLLADTQAGFQPVRLVGLTMSGFENQEKKDEKVQLGLNLD